MFARVQIIEEQRKNLGPERTPGGAVEAAPYSAAAAVSAANNDSASA